MELLTGTRDFPLRVDDYGFLDISSWKESNGGNGFKFCLVMINYTTKINIKTTELMMIMLINNNTQQEHTV